MTPGRPVAESDGDGLRAHGNVRRRPRYPVGVEGVRFRDQLGGAVDFLYDVGTGRPAGFRPVNHTGQGTADILTR